MIALASPASLLAAVSAWEASASAATGLSGTYLRYVISFFLSVLVGWGWRYVPTARGKGGKERGRGDATPGGAGCSISPPLFF